MVEPRQFCVIVHDVTPAFGAEVDWILDQFCPYVGHQISGAAVPRWHGRDRDLEDRGQWELWAGKFGELLLHGWTHYRPHRPGLVSWLTGRADEFSGMPLGEIRQRISDAQSQMKSILGLSLRGFVPPAWQFPCRLDEVQSVEIDYILRFQRLEISDGSSIAVATWSWDWGWLPGTCRVGAMLGDIRHAWHRKAVPVIVLHPADVRRGCVPPAVRLVRRFLHAGWKPVLPGEIADATSRVGNKSVRRWI